MSQSEQAAGLRNLRMLAAYAGLHEVSVAPEVLVRRWDICDDLDASCLPGALEDLGFSARRREGGPDALGRASMPVLAMMRDGTVALVGRVVREGRTGGHVLIQRAPGCPPEAMPLPDFAAAFANAWVEGTPEPGLRGCGGERRGEARGEGGGDKHGGGSTGDAAGLASTGSAGMGLGWFWRAIRKYRPELALVLLASLFVQVFALVTPLAFQVVIDKVLTHGSRATLVAMLAILSGVALCEAVLSGLRHQLLAYTVNRVDVELGSRWFRHLMRLPMAYFHGRRAGDVTAAMRDLETVRAFLTGPALTAWLDLLFAAVFLAVMFCYSAPLTLLVFCFLPVFFGMSHALSPLLRRTLGDRAALAADNQAFLGETIGAMETLKSHVAEAGWQRRWEGRLARYARAAVESGRAASWASHAIGLTSKMLTIVLLGAGARQVIDGHLTVGGLIAFNMLCGRVNAPIVKLASLWQEFQQMRVAARRLADVMSVPVEAGALTGAAGRAPLRGQVEFDRVGFAYRLGGPLALDGVSFAIPQGATVGVVGGSGSGKTTLIRLLQRLYSPASGRILVDGIDLATVDPGWLRSQIGVVSQDAPLLDMSVRDNIAMSNPGISPDLIAAAAGLAGAHAFIHALPRGYDTVVGERGCLLSAGQRARIAIARALAADPCILLFDEATASLDAESERVVQQNLERICAGRTVFMVAHRLTTLRRADIVLVLDKGRLADAGSHEALMARQGPYRSLVDAAAGNGAAVLPAATATEEDRDV